MSKNVRLYLSAEFFRGIYFAYAVATLFYQEIGLNFTQLSLLWLGMALAQLILEIPCGIISDRFGHRFTVLIGYICFAACMAVIGCGTDFWLPFIGGILWGVSAALLSGSSDAFLYDTLKYEQKEDAYLKVLGIRSMFTSLGIIVGAIPGAYLYIYDIRWPWFFHAASIGIGFLLLSCARSAPMEVEDKAVNAWQHLRSSAKSMWSNRPLLWLSIFTTLCTFPLYGFSMIRQPYLISRELEVSQLGYIFAVIEILGSVVSYQAHRIEKKLGLAKSLCVVVVALGAAYYALSVIQTPWSLMPLAILFATFRFNMIVINAHSNVYMKSEQRATMLSIQSMGGSIFLLCFMLGSGMILDAMSMDYYLLLLSGYVACVLLPLFLLRKRFAVDGGSIHESGS